MAERSGFVALVGWTNVGKSTLLNHLVGTKLAAVADVPQTTRNRITGVRSFEGRGQLVFVDTPGFHRPRYRMNHTMIDLARRTLGSVDVVLQVIDAERGLGSGDAELAELLRRSDVPRMAALNKIDRVAPKSRLLPMLQTVVEQWGASEAVPISAKTGEGCDVLVDRLFAAMPEGEAPFPDDFLTDQPERALAAEWIREKLLHHTRQELPHATAVAIDRWLERADGLVEVHATVLVERESQKAIVIGREGSMIRTVGTEARRDLERLLDTRVYLDLRVAVQRDWRNDPGTLRDLGLG
jgi:GTP-binding protein Era